MFSMMGMGIRVGVGAGGKVVSTTASMLFAMRLGARGAVVRMTMTALTFLRGGVRGGELGGVGAHVFFFRCFFSLFFVW